MTATPKTQRPTLSRCRGCRTQLSGITYLVFGGRPMDDGHGNRLCLACIDKAFTGHQGGYSTLGAFVKKYSDTHRAANGAERLRREVEELRRQNEELRRLVEDIDGRTRP